MLDRDTIRQATMEAQLLKWEAQGLLLDTGKIPKLSVHASQVGVRFVDETPLTPRPSV